MVNITRVNQPSQQMPTQSMPNQQVQQPNREVELANQIVELEEKISNSEYYNNLSDEKYFRLQLLNAINRVSISLNSLQEKLVELTGGKE